MAPRLATRFALAAPLALDFYSTLATLVTFILTF